MKYENNVIDWKSYSHVDNWDDNPLARRVAYRLAHKDLRDRYLIAKQTNDYHALDQLDREWEGLSRY